LYTTAGTKPNPEIIIALIADYETTKYNPFSPRHNSMDFRCHYSYAIMWALSPLSIHSDVQTKLRDKLFTIQSDNPIMDELNSLSYPELAAGDIAYMFSTMRLAVKDDFHLECCLLNKKGRVCDKIL